MGINMALDREIEALRRRIADPVTAQVDRARYQARLRAILSFYDPEA